MYQQGGCGFLGLNCAAQTYDALQVANQVLGQHEYVQGTFCPFVTCVSLTFQGGHMWGSFTPISLTKIFTKKPSVFFGVSVGVNGATADQEIRDNAGFGGGVADVFGGGGGETWYNPGSGSSRDFYPYAYATLGEGFVVQGSMVDSWRFF
jgi:hypothetical protein